MMTVLDAPPIRYSVGQNDFDPEIGRRLRIYVDGAEQKQVIEYDCEAGTVVRFALDADGSVRLNAKRDDALRETVKGAVTVEWAD